MFLEPIEAQATVLEKWMDMQALKDMLDDLPGDEQRAKEMLAAYIAGDETKIHALSDQRARRLPDEGPDRAASTTSRWMTCSTNATRHGSRAIEKHARGGRRRSSPSVRMHLIGKRSVLDLLQKKGYKVTRITPSPRKNVVQ